MTDKQKIDKALEIAFQYGQIDGSHHRLWVIDQMVRVLSDDYDTFVKEYEEEDENGEKLYIWDCGITP